MRSEYKIKEVIAQLEKWATESEVGGWSTHQVRPMRQLADHLKAFLYDYQRGSSCSDSRRW